MECPPEVENCPDRQEESRSGSPAECPQCENGMRPEEVHFHILESEGLASLCKDCWSKGPLPEEDRTLNFEFQFHGVPVSRRMKAVRNRRTAPTQRVITE